MQAGGGGGETSAGSVYRGLRSRRSGAMLGDINVTPLVDVVLVLLLVFMVTAPMMSRGIDVSLPVANQPDVPPDVRINVSINAQGKVYIGNDPILLPLLEDNLRGRLMGATSHVAYLSADRSLQYGKVIEVVDIMKRAGVDQIGFVYELPSEKTR